MKNPYQILEVSQDANNSQIIKAQMLATRKRQYSNNEIAQARSQLIKPATRLAADFTFPVFEPFDDLKPLKATLQFDVIDINSIDPNAYNSL